MRETVPFFSERVYNQFIDLVITINKGDRIIIDETMNITIASKLLLITVH